MHTYEDMHTCIHHTCIHKSYIHTYIHACIHVYMHTCRLSNGLRFSTFWGRGFRCSVSFTHTHTNTTYTHTGCFRARLPPRRPLNLKHYCIRERLRERVVRTQHRGQHGRWTTHAGVCTCIGARETSLSDSRGWGASARLEGRDSTCREAGANLLSSTVVVSDCVSLYLSGASARADVALPP